MFKHIIADGKEWTVFEPDKATILKSKQIDFVRKDAKYIEDILSISDTYGNAIDCGACYGFWTYLLQPYFKNIYAFELVNAHRICFLKNMENFHISNYKLFPFGLGNKAINCSVGNNVWAIEKFGYAAFNAHVIEDKNGDEKIRTLDSFNLRNISFIKIDVEGYEINLLKGAYDTIKRDKPVIFIEKTITNDNDLVNFLNDLGYDIFKEFEKDILFKKIK